MLKNISIDTLETAAKIWHCTFGRINDRIFRYPVGGEY